MKCGSQECNICKPPRMDDQDFKSLNHLPDPTPGTYDQHYKQFREVFDTKTTQDAMPLPKTSTNYRNKIPFNPAKQHVSITHLMIGCKKCNKQRQVYTAKKLTEAKKKSFNCVMSNMMCTGRATLVDSKDPTNHNNHLYEILNKRFVNADNTRSKPVQPCIITATTLNVDVAVNRIEDYLPEPMSIQCAHHARNSKSFLRF